MSRRRREQRALRQAAIAPRAPVPTEVPPRGSLQQPRGEHQALLDVVRAEDDAAHVAIALEALASAVCKLPPSPRVAAIDIIGLATTLRDVFLIHHGEESVRRPLSELLRNLWWPIETKYHRDARVIEAGTAMLAKVNQIALGLKDVPSALRERRLPSLINAFHKLMRPGLSRRVPSAVAGVDDTERALAETLVTIGATQVAALQSGDPAHDTENARSVVGFMFVSFDLFADSAQLQRILAIATVMLDANAHPFLCERMLIGVRQLVAEAVEADARRARDAEWVAVLAGCERVLRRVMHRGLIGCTQVRLVESYVDCIKRWTACDRSAYDHLRQEGVPALISGSLLDAVFHSCDENNQDASWCFWLIIEQLQTWWSQFPELFAADFVERIISRFCALELVRPSTVVWRGPCVYLVANCLLIDEARFDARLRADASLRPFVMGVIARHWAATEVLPSQGDDDSEGVWAYECKQVGQLLGALFDDRPAVRQYYPNFWKT